MKSFLQSNQWADFQKSLGRKIWRINEVLIIKHDLPFKKNYLYSPRLRFSSFGGQAHFEEWLKSIGKIARQEKAIFLKLEFEDNIDKKILKKFKQSHEIQFQKTLILDLKKSEQELLKQMHQKTRYNIRLAEKKGIEIKKYKKCFEDFWALLKDTAKKGDFHTHIKEHYKKLLEVSGIELFVAVYPEKSPMAINGTGKNKIIAANIIMFYNKTAIYLHGASDYNHRNLMAPYLLQWHQILEAKNQGCLEYDFWGIDEKKWPGVTRFKRGFSGKEIEYSGAYDLVFQPFWYKIYKIARKIL
jgi:lipid II:glycine glycyltransferase (peptidoglycan interpeptide bridge formation enzyme)